MALGQLQIDTISVQSCRKYHKFSKSCLIEKKSPQENNIVYIKSNATQLVKKRQHYQVLPTRKGGKERGSEGRQMEEKGSFPLIEENDDQ